MEGDVVTMTDLFQFHPAGLDENKKLTGTFRATGLRPSFSQDLVAAGFTLSPAIFQN
jgi:pilus assembly protein CpaF